MGERAQRAYEEAEGQAFRALPFSLRLRSYLLGLVAVIALVALLMAPALAPLIFWLWDRL